VYPILGTPKLFDGPTVSVNFLLGGLQSGLPLHSHSKTWQGLASGRKLWFFVPPRRTSQDLEDLTGPYLFPVRGYAKMTQGLPLGKRPLICVQKPGDIFYFPDEWLHGTLNLDKFQLAWGGKPADRQTVEDSAALKKLNDAFPDDKLSDHDMMLSDHISLFSRQCNKNPDADKRAAVEKVDRRMQRMRQLSEQAKDKVHNDALVENAAYAFCRLSDKISKGHCPNELKKELVGRWRSSAQAISPSVYKAEC